MNQAWTPTLVATLATILFAMAALALGLVLGRSEPRGGSCARALDGSCICTPERPRCRVPEHDR